MKSLQLLILIGTILTTFSCTEKESVEKQQKSSLTLVLNGVEHPLDPELMTIPVSGNETYANFSLNTSAYKEAFSAEINLYYDIPQLMFEEGKAYTDPSRVYYQYWLDNEEVYGEGDGNVSNYELQFEVLSEEHVKGSVSMDLSIDGQIENHMIIFDLFPDYSELIDRHDGGSGSDNPGDNDGNDGSDGEPEFTSCIIFYVKKPTGGMITPGQCDLNSDGVLAEGAIKVVLERYGTYYLDKVIYEDDLFCGIDGAVTIEKSSTDHLSFKYEIYCGDGSFLRGGYGVFPSDDNGRISAINVRSN